MWLVSYLMCGLELGKLGFPESPCVVAPKRVCDLLRTSNGSSDSSKKRRKAQII